MLFRKGKKSQEAGPPSHDMGETSSNEKKSSTPNGAKSNEGDAVPVDRTTSRIASDGHEYPQGLKLTLLMVATFISMFLVALDRLIVSTAIPAITDEFNSLPDVGWYGSIYLLTQCSFQLMFGKLYGFYSVKAVFLVSVVLFEAGSAICGAAPSSSVFIGGRAIQGLGAAGIFSGVLVIIVYAVPLHKRPMFQGLFGVVFGLASILGPLVGGAFTTNVSWRWCFYINLPIGGVALVAVAILLEIPDREETRLPFKHKIMQLDLLGTSVLVPGVVCLLLALQWGGLTYAWGSGRIIALLVVAGVLLVSFVLVQIFMPDTATVPPRIFCQRSMLSGVFATLCIGSHMMIFVYYLPIWFQAIKGVSAVSSGIYMLPLTLAMVVSSMITGISTGKTGYYTPFFICGFCIIAVAAGLMTTFQVDTDQAKWVGYQFLYGWGMGLSFQAPNLAAQTVLPLKDVSIGASLMFFSQLMGGAIFISVGQNILDNKLIENLSGLPGFNPESVIKGGATALRTSLPSNLLGPVLVGYNNALRVVFQIGVIMACIGIIPALGMEWRNVKTAKNPEPDAELGANRGAGASAAPATNNKQVDANAIMADEKREQPSRMSRTASKTSADSETVNGATTASDSTREKEGHESRPMTEAAAKKEEGLGS